MSPLKKVGWIVAAIVFVALAVWVWNHPEEFLVVAYRCGEENR